VKKNKNIDYLRLQDKIFLVICKIFNYFDKEYLTEQKQKKYSLNKKAMNDIKEQYQSREGV